MTEDPKPGARRKLPGVIPTPGLVQAHQLTELTEETAQKLLRAIERSQPIQRLRASQLLTAVLGTVGLALFLVGVEKAAGDIPVISNAYGSIAVGVILLAATGLLLRRLTGPE